MSRQLHVLGKRKQSGVSREIIAHRYTKSARTFGSGVRPTFFGDHDTNASGTATESTQKAMTRNEAVMRQMGVNLAVSVRPDEMEYRAAIAKGKAGARLYGPATEDPDTIKPRKGLLGICRFPPNGTFRTQLGTRSAVEVITATNGLSVDEHLGMVGICETQVHEGNQQLTLTVHGIDSIVHYGQGRLQVGDYVVADLSADVTSDGSPLIYGPEGIPKKAQNIKMASMGPLPFHSWLQEAKRICLSILIPANKNVDDTLRSTVGGADDKGEALCRFVMERRVEALRDHFHVPHDHPVHGYADIFMLTHLADLFTIKSAESITASNAAGNPLYATLAFKAQQAKRLALIQLEKFFLGHRVRFDSFLPRDFDPHRKADASSVLQSAAVTELGKATSAEEMVTGGKIGHLMSAIAQLNMAALASLSEQETRIRDYLHRFGIGTILSACEKTQSTDVFFGSKP